MEVAGGEPAEAWSFTSRVQSHAPKAEPLLVHGTFSDSPAKLPIKWIFYLFFTPQESKAGFTCERFRYLRPMALVDCQAG
jgi:hypothetical protein